MLNKLNNWPFECYGKIDKWIDKGTYGNIYTTSKNYVVKDIKFYDDHFHQYLYTSVLREIAIPLSLNHPTIISYHDIFIQHGIVSVVMDHYCGSLRHLLKRKVVIPFSIIQKISHQLIIGLSYLASSNIIHRDIKPENIFYTSNYDIVYGDFGLATTYNCLDLERTFDVYTLWYRPPEILLKYSNYDSIADIWALGCVIYELYTSKPLFPGKNKKDMLDSIYQKLGYRLISGKSYHNAFISKISSSVMSSESIFLVRHEKLNDLLIGMLHPHPKHRTSIYNLQTHSFFDDDNNLYPLTPTPTSLETLFKPFEYPSNFNNIIWMEEITLYDLSQVQIFLIDISINYSYNIETLVLAFQILYRYLSETKDTLLQSLLSIAIGCLAIADHYLNDDSHSLDIFESYLPDYNKRHLVSCMIKIITQLNYNLNINTPCDHIIVHILTYDSDVIILAKKFLVLCLAVPSLYLTYENQLGNCALQLALKFGFKYLDEYHAIFSTINSHYVGKDRYILTYLIPEWERLKEINI